MSSGSPLGYHLMLRLVDDRVMAPTPASRRALVRCVAEQGEARGLLAFGAADTHVHLLTMSDRATAGRLAHAVETALRSALELPVGFEAVRVRPVLDQAHLRHTFRYVQQNPAHHGVQAPEATEATSLHDLLGLRVVAPWLIDRVRASLPRTSREELTDMLGVRATVFDGAPEPAAARIVVDAAAAVACLPSLDGKTPAACNARAIAVASLMPSHRRDHVADALGVTPRTVRRLVSVPPPTAYVAAMRRQLAWRGALRRSPLEGAAAPSR
jgi:hypothetical protein